MHTIIYFILANLLLIIAWGFGDFFEASMAMHMLIQIPLILFAGIAFYLSLKHSRFSQYNLYKVIATKLKKFNMLGISGFLFISLVSMYWMIPKALDSVLVSEYAQLSKYLSVLISGWLIHISYKASHTVVRLFFIGIVCWTMAIVGLLYQETDTRLCNFYLIGDQQLAGFGLVILAVVLPICWMAAEALQYRRTHPKQA